LSDNPPSDTLEVEIHLDEEVEIHLDELIAETPPRAEAPCPPRAKSARPQRKRTQQPQPTEPTQTQPTQPPPPATPAQPQSATPQSAQPQSALPARFGEIVARVADGRLRALADSTLVRILKTLEALRPVEAALTRQKPVTVGALFVAVRAQATSLLAFLTESVVNDDGIGEEFRELLDGIRFVMAHEMGKVFSYEFPALTSAGPSQYSRAELTRAWGLLHNCLQQTAITLVRTIDPDATGQELFEDYRSKTENSLTLYRELQLLLQKVKTAEKANGILLKHSLVRHLEHFREETMHFLMYKDWGEFGRYVDEVKRAFEEMEDFDCVLHGLAQYLSTLIHHVGMREVLTAGQAQAPAPAAAPRAAEQGAPDTVNA
jgi:hypothetical protein